MEGLFELLDTRHEEVRSRLEDEVRTRLVSQEPARSVLLATLPQLLDALQSALGLGLQGSPPPSTAPPTGAPASPDGPWQPPPGLGTAVLTRAYGLLREELLRLLEESGGALRFSELRVLNRFLDRSLETTLVESERYEAERGTAEQEQKDTVELLDALLAASPVGMSFLDRELRYVLINHALAAINGVPVELTIGRTLRQIIPDIAPTLETIYQRVLESGQPVLDVEVSGTTQALHGAQGSWLVSYYPVKDQRGEPIMVGAVVVDITERKRTVDSLARNAARLEAILESIPDAVYVGDAEAITHANAPGRELLGGGFGRISPLDLGEQLQCRDPDTGQRLSREEQPFARALRGEAVTRDVVLRHPGTGRSMVARSAAAPVRMGERIVGAVVINTDMTEHQRREEELRRTAEFRERFLGIVSHDLRNPLNAIALSAGVLLREEELAERARKAAGRISQSAERMARMIGDLLDFTRGRLGGGIPITRQQVDLSLICRPALEELRVARPDRELRLVMEGSLQGEWDADRLAQLAGNLVKNALDYSPKELPVTVALLGEEEWVRLEVHNLGEPIPPEVLPGLFEPFRRGMRKENGSQGSGLGLGLFIAREIALAHGGTLDAHSTREEGTTFTVRLPRTGLTGA